MPKHGHPPGLTSLLCYQCATTSMDGSCITDYSGQVNASRSLSDPDYVDSGYYVKNCTAQNPRWDRCMIETLEQNGELPPLPLPSSSPFSLSPLPLHFSISPLPLHFSLSPLPLHFSFSPLPLHLPLKNRNYLSLINLLPPLFSPSGVYTHYHRGCHDGKTFSQQFNSTRFRNISPTNETVCGRVVVLACYTFCTTDLCNGPQVPQEDPDPCANFTVNDYYYTDTSPYDNPLYALCGSPCLEVNVVGVFVAALLAAAILRM